MIEVRYNTEHHGALSLESMDGVRIRSATPEDLAAAGYIPKDLGGDAPVPLGATGDILAQKTRECADALEANRLQQLEIVRLVNEIWQLRCGLSRLLDKTSYIFRAPNQDSSPIRYFLIERRTVCGLRWLAPGELHNKEVAWTNDRAAATHFDTREAAELSRGILQQSTSIYLTVTEHDR